MKWLTALFGRARVPPSRLESLFALTTARITFDTKLALRARGRAGVVLRAVESSFYQTADQELDHLLEIAGRETGTTVARQRDRFGFDWLIVQDDDLDDQVAAAHLIGQTLRDHGFADRLLAAIFGFADAEDRTVYWVYAYKRGTFYPFVPTGRGTSRDNAYELRLSAVMARELPIEADQTRWYPLWGAPI